MPVNKLLEETKKIAKARARNVRAGRNMTDREYRRSGTSSQLAVLDRRLKENLAKLEEVGFNTGTIDWYPTAG